MKSDAYRGIARGRLLFAVLTALVAMSLHGSLSAQFIYGNWPWPKYQIAQAPDNGPEAAPTAVGDLNGDGIVDLVVSQGTCAAKVCLNDGTGRFTTSTVPAPPIQVCLLPSSFCLVDVDQDGDLDLVIGVGVSVNAPVLLYRNDGHANFTYDAAAMPTTFVLATAVASLDVDQDGDQDLVIGRKDGTQVLLYLNNGNGTFVDGTATRLPGCTDRVQSILQLDVDQDGDLDFVTVSGGYYGGPQPVRLFLNDGMGHFTFGVMSGILDGTQARVADLNGDGLPDLVVAAFQKPTAIYINGGQGGLRDESFRFPAPHVIFANSVAVGDVDGDGDVDLVFAVTYFSGTNSIPRLYLNDSHGNFTEWTSAIQPNALSAGRVYYDVVEVADFDSDGDLDMFLEFPFITIGGPTTVFYHNLRRQLITQATVGIGQPIAFQHFALPGHVMVCALSAAGPPTQIGPFGLWFLDPSQMVTLSPVLIGPSGTATLTLPVPADARLRGQKLWSQAIDIEPAPPFAARFTNPVWDLIQ